MSTPLELVAYYAGLLIRQYKLLPRATAHVKLLVAQAIMCQTTTQDIAFGGVPSTGAFSLSWDGNASASIGALDSTATIQTKLRAISGLGSIVVTGSLASQILHISFDGVVPPADLLVVVSNTLEVGEEIFITEDGETLTTEGGESFELE